MAADGAWRTRSRTGTLELAAVTGLPTIGCRRAGGGLAGQVFVSGIALMAVALFIRSRSYAYDMFEIAERHDDRDGLARVVRLRKSQHRNHRQSSQ